MTAAECMRFEGVDGDAVIAWRLEELVRAGYSPDDGTQLALAQRVDLHLAIDLLANGCPPETALQILL
jgi:hypothetical protein